MKSLRIIINVFVSLSIMTAILFFCTDPTKPDFTTPDPFSFVLYSNSSATDTLNSGDTSIAGDTLFLIMLCNRPGDIDTLFLELKNQAGTTLFDTTKSNFDTSVTNKFLGHYIPNITGTITLNVKLVLIDSLVTESFQLFIKGLPPSIGNNKEIQTSGAPHTDSSFYMYISASGTDTLKYQWFKDSVAITGQINDTLSFAALTFQDTGSYHITVTNDWGADTSKPYNLSFHTPHWVADTLHALVDEGAVLSITLTDSCIDPDNDTLTFTLADGPPIGDTIINQATYTYTPAYSDAGVYDIPIQASDDTYQSSAILQLTVNNVNRKPVFSDSLPKPSYKIDEGDSLIINFKATDPDNDTVIYILAENTLPRPQTVVFNDSQLVWVSTSTDSGLFKVSIYATDSIDTAKTPVDVAVGNVNLPPQISINGYQSGDTMKVKEAKALTFTVEAVDPDTSGPVALLSAANKPQDATYDTTTGLFTYIPGFSVSTGNLNYTFANVTFYATDNSNTRLLDTFVIHITILDSNCAPKWSISSDNINATEGVLISYDFSAAYIGDDEGDSVVFSESFGIISADSIWSWTPDFSSNGDTICEITASDNHVPPAQSKLTLNITVKDSTPAVTLSKPTNLTYKSMQLSWTQSTDPDFSVYKLYYSISPGVTEQSTLARSITDIFTTTATIDSLSENTHYYVKMFVYNTQLSVSGSNEVDSTTPILNPPVINITYPTITRDSCFVKEISPSITGNVSTAAEMNTMSATINGVAATVNLQPNNDWSLNVSTATKQQWNEIMIQAVDIEGKSTDTTFQMYYMPTLTPPTGLDTSNTKNRSVKLTWNPATYCTRYRLYRSRLSGGPFTCIADTTATSYTDALLPINTQYWYQVKGYYTASGGFNMHDSTDFSGLATGKTKNWFFVTFDQGLGEATCVRQTKDSGYVIVGFNYDEISHEIDAVILKTNESGDSLWLNTFGGTSDDKAHSIEETTDGGFIITGYTESEGAGGKDVYLIKTDEHGNTTSGGWTKTLGSTFDDAGNSIKQTLDDGYIIAGYTNSSVSREKYAYLIKTDANGNTNTGGWTKTFRGQEAKPVLQTSDDGFAMLTLIPIFLIKTNSSGDTTGAAGWTNSHSGSEPQFIYQFTDGYVLIVNDNSEVCVIETNEYGDMMDKKTFPVSDFMSVGCADKTTDGYIIAGGYWGTKFSTYLLKINDNYTKQWESPIAIDNYDIYGKSIQQTFDGGYIITGYIQNENGSKWFLLKTDENGYFEY